MKKNVMKTLAAVLTAGVVLGFQTPAGAETTPRLQDVGGLVDQIVPAQLAKDRIPGAAVVVVAGGRTVFAKGYGVADVTTRAPVDPDRTGFFTGSMSKLFTATAALQLVRQGKLDLHADVNRYLTTFKIKNTYPGRPVTLDHLLTYTAGFDDDVLGLAEGDPRDVTSLGRSLADRQPSRVRPPGAKVAYNNYGVALAGYLVEIASGQPFAQYVDQHILEPLDMNSTTMAVPHPAAVDATLARGYRPSGDGYTAEKGQYGPWAPSGTGPVTTVADMGRFMLAQLRGDPRLGPDVARVMQQQHYTQDSRMPGMGYAFEQRPRGGRQLVYKDGDVPGFHNVMALLPGQDIGIYVAYNGDGTDLVASSDGVRLIDQIVDRHLPVAPAHPQGVKGDVSRFAGTYRSARVSQGSLMKVASLFSAPTVAAGADGTLTTTGLSPDPAKATQHWIQIQPGLFQERGGQDRIAFDGKGTMTTSANPSEALERLTWYDSSMPHVSVLGFGALVYLLALLGFPIVALLRALRRRPRHPAGARVARLLAWLTGTLVTVFLAAIALVTADPNALMETTALDSPRLAVVPVIVTVAFGCAVLMLPAVVAAWWKGWWGRTGRLSYTLIALTGVAFFKIAMIYNLVVPA